MAVAITKVGAGPSSNGASIITATMTARIAKGERALFVICFNAAVTVTAVVDSKGNTWTQRLNPGVINNSNAIAFDSILTEALEISDTVTLYITATVRHSTTAVHKVTGAKQGAPTATAALAGVGTSWSGNNVTGPTNGGMAICIFNQNGTATQYSPGAGWAEIHEGTTNQGVEHITRSLAAAEVQTPAGTASGSTAGNGGASVSLVYEAAGSSDAPVAHGGVRQKSDLPNLVVDCIDRSTNNPTSWLWTFGDGGSSTEQNPQHLYTKPGSYVVELTATNDGGSDSESRTVNVGTVAIPTEGQLWPRGGDDLAVRAWYHALNLPVMGAVADSVVVPDIRIKLASGQTARLVLVEANIVTGSITIQPRINGSNAGSSFSTDSDSAWEASATLNTALADGDVLDFTTSGGASSPSDLTVVFLIEYTV